MCAFLDRNGDCPKVGIKKVGMESARFCRYYRNVWDMESADAKIYDGERKVEDIKEFPDCHSSNVSEGVKAVDASTDGASFDSSTGMISNCTE